MSDIHKNNPIQKFNRNDPRYIKTSEAEATRSKKGTQETHFLHHEKPVKKSLLLFTKVMQNLERKFSSPEKEDTSHLSADEAEFYSILGEFLEMLETLASEDVSKNIPFINNLSTIWEGIIHIYQRRLRLKEPPPYLHLLKDTVKEIEGYGADGGQSFGFYLKEHENTDWFPIPYLKMLRHL
ncbi:hypothetical protein K0U07_02040, partial [bacterium]|nr:hypothetical protein [bacterium]